MSTLFEDHRPLPPMTLSLKVPHRAYAYVTSLSHNDVKQMRPADVCDKGKSKETQSATYSKLQSFLKQPVRREGDDMIVSEKYGPPRSGCAGRLWSTGSQNVWSPIRSVLYSEFAEIDQQRSIHRILAFLCRTFDVRALMLEAFLTDPDAYTRDLMTSHRITKKRAKYLFQLAWTVEEPLSRVKDEFLKAFDKEAKVVRAKLMRVEVLRWMEEKSNGAGSFVSNLTQFVEAKLSAKVLETLQRNGVTVYASVFDGLYVNKAHHGSTEVQQWAYDACEEVAPGIGMTWGWKLPDPTVHDREGNAVRTLAVPDDFVPTANREDEWDPETQPTYDDFHDPREGYKDVVYPGLWRTYSNSHCKVGPVIVDNDTHQDKYVICDETKLIKQDKHLVTYLPPVVAVDADGVEYLRAGTLEEDFVHRWLKDHRMDPRYNKDKGEGGFRKYFDCFPNEDACPEDCFNTWRGFAAQDMPAIDWESESSSKAREFLHVILSHIKMLCGGEKVQYEFLLDLLAHSVQYPEDKVGIMICLVGPKGCGKTVLWEAIRATIGRDATFETEQPDRDIWGDNNSCMLGRFFVRITEASRKEFAGHVNKMRTKVTDKTIRVRALYGAAENVRSFHRFYLDTNNEDAIPDEHDERRFFIIKCSDEKVGDAAYFTRVAEATVDKDVVCEQGIRALYEFLMQRSCKKHYVGSDIPVGEFARTLRDHNRSHGDQFVQAVVEDQTIDKTSLTWTASQVYDFYTHWQSSGREFERTKTAVTRGLELGSIPGIQKKVTINEQKKQERGYTFDLVALRKRYGMDHAIASALEERERDAIRSAARAAGSTSLVDLAIPSGSPPLPPTTIDVAADIHAAFGEGGDEPSSSEYVR